MNTHLHCILNRFAMDPEDYPSDSDASDEDFRPDKDDGDSLSEEDSDENLESHDAEDNEETGGGKKRKRKTDKVGKKKVKIEKVENSRDKEEKVLDEEDEERLTDALWADFLAGSGSSNGSASTSSNTVRNDPPRPTTSIPRKISETVKTTTITKVFEFAGEAVEVTEEIPESKEPTQKISIATSNGNVGPSKPFPGRSSGGGLGAVLSQIGKKNKLSTLEKTKLDWNSFKRNQGIEEELQTHNKGKDGYLERQDFLQRADVRQFEIEKTFRQTTRSNR